MKNLSPRQEMLRKTCNHPCRTICKTAKSRFGLRINILHLLKISNEHQTLVILKPSNEFVFMTALMLYFKTIHPNKTSVSFSNKSIYDLMVEKMFLWLQFKEGGSHHLTFMDKCHNFLTN